MLRGFGGGGRTGLPWMGGIQGSLWGALSGGHWDEPCRGGGRLRVRAQLRSAIYQVHSRQGPSRQEVSRGRLQGVSTPRGGVVSRKRRGRDLSGLQGTGSVKLGCLLPPSDVQRGAQGASEVGLLVGKPVAGGGVPGPAAPQLHQRFCC